jgi:hypothetical protein
MGESKGVSAYLEFEANAARSWQGKIEGDKSGHAKGLAEKYYTAFSSFLIEDYLPSGHYKLAEAEATPFAENVRLKLEKISGILDGCLGSNAGQVRRNIMKHVNSHTTEEVNNGFLEQAGKKLNEVKAFYPVAASHPDFTRENILDLYNTTQELKDLCKAHVHGTSSFYAGRVKHVSASHGGEGLPSELDLSDGRQSTQRSSGRRQPGGSIEIEPGSPAQSGVGRLSSISRESTPVDPAPGSQPSRSPSVVPETPPADLAAIIENPATPPSAQQTWDSPYYGPPLSMSEISASPSPSRGVSPNPERFSRASAPGPQTPPANVTRTIENLATPPAMQPGKRHRSPEAESPETPTAKRQRLSDRPDGRSDATSI